MIRISVKEQEKIRAKSALAAEKPGFCAAPDGPGAAARAGHTLQGPVWRGLQGMPT